MILSKNKKRKLQRKRSKQKLKLILLIKQGCLCYYCPVALTVKNSTFDHKIPKSRGGKNTQSNLVLACNKCNQDKDNMTDEEFFLVIRNKVPVFKVKS